MGEWFRDLFIDGFMFQKLGGYDPFQKEYVLAANNIAIPVEIECIECGVTRTYILDDRATSELCVNVGLLVGDVNINYKAIDVLPGSFEIEATYNGVVVTTGNTQVSGTLVVDKDTVGVSVIDLALSGFDKDVTVEITIECPDANIITLFQICVSNDTEAGQFIHNEYQWTDGTYVSPLHSTPVQLQSGTTNPLVSQYDIVVGPQGAGIIPANGADISVISRKIAPVDDFVFENPIDSFRYLRSSTLYDNTPVDIAALLAASTLIVPTTGSAPKYQGNFTMPGGTFEYLYLIYDYRNSQLRELCYSAVSASDAFCGCSPGVNFTAQQCRADNVINEVVVGPYTGAKVGDFVEITPDGFLGTCIFRLVETTSDPDTAAITAIRTDIYDCSQVCNMYDIENVSGGPITLTLTDCVLGTPYELAFTTGQTWTNVCARDFDVVFPNTDYVFTLTFCDCLA